jgi:spore coat protein A
MLQDRIFESDGSLHYPHEFVPTFSGDTAFVNGAVWPYVEVEPRRYRFRLVNQSNGRTFALSLEGHGDEQDDHGDGGDHAADVPTMYQFAPDQGFLEDVVAIGSGGDMESLVIAPFERAEIVVAYSEYAGETFTLTNHAEFPFSGGGHGGDHGEGGSNGEDGGMDGGMGGGHDRGAYHFELPEIMQFRVSESASSEDDSAHPTELDLPNRSSYSENAVTETRHMTMGMKMANGLPTHVLNGKTFHEDPAEDEYPEPQLGTTEVWELQNDTMHTHPIHVHLVDFEVIGRGEDGTEDPLPNERGPKDVVRGTTARPSASSRSSATSPARSPGTVTSSSTRRSG